MSDFYEKMKFHLKKVAILTGFFLILFFASFYLVNLLDFDSAPKVPALQTAGNLADGDAELQLRAGKDNINLADFAKWAEVNGLIGENLYDGDSDGDKLANYLEYIHGTDPSNADSDADGFSDRQELTNGYDPDSKGDAMTVVSVKIDKIGVEAPMVYSKTDIEANMLKDLEKGLSHFLGTASPGQNGNMIVSGHSSNYAWAKGNYNNIFKDLNNLEAGDLVVIKTAQKNGRMIDYNYQVVEKYITAPDDEKIFLETESPTLTLSTCWPLGTSLKRVIVKAQLVK